MVIKYHFGSIQNQRKSIAFTAGIRDSNMFTWGSLHKPSHTQQQNPNNSKGELPRTWLRHAPLTIKPVR